MNDNGGLAFSAGARARSAEILYTWAEASDFATPFVANPTERSNVVGTIDFNDDVDAAVDRQGPARQRRRRHRALPQARPQPAAHRDVPECRPRGRRVAVRVHQLRRGEPLADVQTERGHLRGPL